MTRGHGDDLYRYVEGSIKANFSSNICSAIDNAKIKQHLVECLPRILDSYPEPEPYTAESEWAQAIGVPSDSVLITSGATDAIYTVAAAMRCGVAAVWQPTFSEYADASRAVGMPYMDCRSLQDALSYLEGVDAPDRLLWLCNPNNPDGRLLSREELLFRVDSFPDILFVVDISYTSFCQGEANVSETDSVLRPNLILIRSLTKQYKLPGLRVGVLVGSADLVARVRGLRMPWSVSAPAIEAVRYILHAYGAHSLPLDIEALWAEAARLADALRALHISVAPSDTHYMLCKLPMDGAYTATELKEVLAARYGLLIRDASNFVGLTPWHFRIAAQTAKQNDLLIAALRSEMFCQ